MKNLCDNCEHCLFTTPMSPLSKSHMIVEKVDQKPVSWYMIPGALCTKIFVHMNDVVKCSQFKQKP